ncbi:hypothetical protein B932_3194 [Gluconobacter oxydans H24]|nr:hypothetical protein B932_3194 [Gluconobacter oxydans H24]
MRGHRNKYNTIAFIYDFCVFDSFVASIAQTGSLLAFETALLLRPH